MIFGQSDKKPEAPKIDFKKAKECIVRKEINADTEECKEIRKKMNLSEE